MDTIYICLTVQAVAFILISYYFIYEFISFNKRLNLAMNIIDIQDKGLKLAEKRMDNHFELIDGLLEISGLKKEIERLIKEKSKYN